MPHIGASQLDVLGGDNLRRFHGRADHAALHRRAPPGRRRGRRRGPELDPARDAATLALVVAAVSLVLHASVLLIALARAAW